LRLVNLCTVSPFTKKKKTKRKQKIKRKEKNGKERKRLQNNLISTGNPKKKVTKKINYEDGAKNPTETSKSGGTRRRKEVKEQGVDMKKWLEAVNINGFILSCGSAT
jgi:hypothetical protein